MKSTLRGGIMMSAQTLSALVTTAIYGGLIAFVLYRQMRAQPLRGRRLVLFPAVLGLFAFQQLARQPLEGLGAAAILVLSLAVGAAAGLWRGSTFRLWEEGGSVFVKGTGMTLVTWGALIAARLPFAVLSYQAKLPQGLVIGELLLALAVTFAAQNAVVWRRAGRVVHPR
jgi:hypothetical protein